MVEATCGLFATKVPFPSETYVKPAFSELSAIGT
jgi:hypothetical protein